mmetsp:Transcript_27003/g.27487  ORF Transcript_27003/g.27487 Transcript_27003/m.27487 type:complete len:86 (-) Transcript_27003:141-398(-)
MSTIGIEAQKAVISQQYILDKSSVPTILFLPSFIIVGIIDVIIISINLLQMCLVNDILATEYYYYYYYYEEKKNETGNETKRHKQ